MQRTGSNEIIEILSFAKMQNTNFFTNFFFFQKFLFILIFKHFLLAKKSINLLFSFWWFVCLEKAGGGYEERPQEVFSKPAQSLSVPYRHVKTRKDKKVTTT